MEDAATAEVSRSQLWQWMRHQITTAEGIKVSKEYALRILEGETSKLEEAAPKGNKFRQAAQHFSTQITGEDYTNFLTILLYDDITKINSKSAKL
ncbi:malate synthase [Lipomyces kononenkoae]|uniref:Malate synthase n=1 Tax=Lipomyces kononenkoae TaxID=34357 RepID=A0ACC3STL4_LIPKO